MKKKFFFFKKYIAKVLPLQSAHILAYKNIKVKKQLLQGATT